MTRRDRRSTGRRPSITRWLPTVPYTLEQAVRRASGTAEPGSPLGRDLRVWWNDYKGYWILEVSDATRTVVCSGELAICLEHGLAEHRRGLPGTTVVAQLRGDEDVQQAESLGYVMHGRDLEAQHRATFADDRHARVEEALRLERQEGIPAVAVLLQSRTAAEFDAAARDRLWILQHGPERMRLRLNRGDREMTIVVFDNIACFLVGGRTKASLSTEAAREYLREQLRRGWKLF